MKTRVFLIAILTFLVISASFATDYHISNEKGNDSRSFSQAQNPETPWKSIEKLNAVFSSLQPGDKILFRRGETYFGTILMNNSGTASNPIKIGAYGNGENPIITGLVDLTSWKSIGNGIYEAGHSQLKSKPTNLVTFNDKDKEMGRYPNSDSENKGYLTYESTSWNTIKDNELSSWPNWTGAEVVIRKIYWILDRHKITSHSGNTIQYASNSETSYQPKAEFGYFIQNHVKTLDQLGEWYFDTSQAKLKVYFGNESPSTHSVKVAALDHLLTQVTRVDYVVIENLHFKGANSNAIHLSTGKNVTIKNTKVEMVGQNAISGEGNHQLLLEGNEILDIHNSGIELKSCDNAIIRNNRIRNIQLYPGMGKSGDGNGFGIFSPNDNNLIEGNQIINSGYVGIRFGGNNSTVKNNFINHFNKTKNDGGGIYVYTGNSNETFYNRKVIGNIILNGQGVVEGTNIRSALAKPQSEGIYLDDNTSGVEIAYNTIANISSKGIYLHNARQNHIHHNTIYNSTYQLFFRNDHMGADIRNNTVENNLFFSQNGEQNNLNLSSIKNDLGQMANFRNNVYASPLTDNYRIINKYNMGTSSEVTKLLDLDGWKALYGQDAGSTIHPVTIPSYEINGVSGENKYDNEGFDRDVDYVNVKNGKTSWVSSSKLDNGALRVTGTGALEINVNIGKVSIGKDYLIKFSGIGNKEFAGKVYFRQKFSPWKTISAVSVAEFQNERIEYEILLSPAENSEETVLLFKFENANAVDFQIDNLSVKEADLKVTNPDDKIFFAYNEGYSKKSVSLPGEFVDMDNKSYSGSIELDPFRSVLLIKTSEKTTAQPEPIQEARVIIPEYGSGMIEGDDLPITLVVDTGRELEVEKVNYYYCETLISEETETPLASTWQNVPFGSHFIYAEAVDVYGRTIFSDSVAIEVNKQNVIPIITLTQPLENTEINIGESMVVSGSAIDLDGEVARVDLLVNGNPSATSTVSPFEFTWTSAQEGSFTLSLQVVDNENGKGLSDEVVVQVLAKETVTETTPTEEETVGSTPDDQAPAFSLFVNLGTQKEIVYGGTDFEGEQAVSSQISGLTYTYSNTKFQEPLFQTERNGDQFAFEIPVPNGTYTVKTFHNELYFGQAGPSAGIGRRIFDILLEDKMVKENLDFFVENNNQPLVLTFEAIEVIDGNLKIGLSASTNRASISGLAIISASSSTISTPDSDAITPTESVVLEPFMRLKTGHYKNVQYEGEDFIADYNLGYFSASSTYTNTDASSELLFQKERNGEVLNYSIPVPNGSYTIKTYHNELYHGHRGSNAKAGNRVFDIFLEDNLAKDNFDIFVENNNEPTILTFENVLVKDGVLNLGMVASANRASISALAIFKENSVTVEQTGTDHVFFLNTGGETDEEINDDIFVAEENTEAYYNIPSYRFENSKASAEKLFQTERNADNLNYAIPVPNGTYTVLTMHNELWFGHGGPYARAGRRVFDLALEGQIVKEGFDIFEENGNAPTLLAFENITVTDGILNLELTAKENRASISGIAIIGSGAKNAINGSNLRGYREMFGRGYKEMFGRGYKEMDLYVENNEQNEMKIFPNPAKDKASLVLGQEIGQGRVLIHNMNGQLVGQFELDWIRTSGNQFTIPLDNLSQGMYLISVSNDQTIVNKQRLIVNP
ncbi:malectin domain-containing carbohydrate-binding protein [Cyclobacterium jeungdonense]|uniref:Malectin domain-containing carbohydrate-binding protein n=1 Tax=Cyclobacterium jeungdonense TaxID=708087 RepID=A0ABT8C4C1_9BACT|nr:malectin domain-containing carbohydrate-binding protein [Cyclobacterium jeungdonense]MDN3686611.1 malectin domain-containing carbohydrate-binding protein [Cyclobacterium jeungdonense]